MPEVPVVKHTPVAINISERVPLQVGEATFYLRYLPRKIREHIKEKILRWSVEYVARNKEAVAVAETSAAKDQIASPEEKKRILESAPDMIRADLLRIGIHGWEGFKFADGASVECKFVEEEIAGRKIQTLADDSIDAIPDDLFIIITNAIYKMNFVTAEQKNV